MYRGAFPAGGFIRVGCGVGPLDSRAIQLDGEVVDRYLVQLQFEQLDGVGGMPAGADEIDDLQPDVRIACLIRGQRLVDETPLLLRVPGGTRHGGRERQDGQRGRVLHSQHQPGGPLETFQR